MKKRIVSALALALVFVMTAMVMTGCGGEKVTTITVFNWFDYIDESVIEKFTEETGIPIVIVLDSMESVIGKSLTTTDIFSVVIFVALIVVAIVMIVKALKKRRTEKA